MNKLVKVWGKCAGATPTSGKVTLFTITDGYTTPLRVKVGTSQYVGTAAQVNGQFAVIVGTIKSDVDGRFIQLVSSSLDKTPPVPTYTITSSVVGGNGTISPTPSATVNQGANQTFNFNAASGYVPDQYTIDGGTPVAAGASYTFINVQANHSISVTFKLIPLQFTINSSAGPNGTIDPSGIVGVLQGADQQFDFLPAVGYVPDEVTIDGGTPAPAGASYSFFDVQADHTISVTFETVPTTATRYEAELSVLSSGGDIWYEPNASNGARTAASSYGSNFTNTFTVNVAAQGMYELAMGYCNWWADNIDTHITVNGVPGTIDAPRVAEPGYGRTLKNIELKEGVNTIVLSNGSDGWGPHWDYIDIPFDVSWIINASVDPLATGGTISPAGDVGVAN